MSFWEKRYRERGLEWGEGPSLVGRTAATYLAGRGVHNKILDIGCGYGRDCFYLAGKGFDVIGMDVAQFALGLGEEWKRRVNADNIQFLCADMQNMVFKPDSFGAVALYNAMQLLDECQRRKMAAEIKRILQPKGLLIQAVFSTKEEGYGCGVALEKNSYPTGAGRLRHFFTREELEILFVDFKVLCLEEVVIPERQVGKPPHFHQEWLMVLEKKA